MEKIRDDAGAWFESMGQEIQDYEVPPMPVVDGGGAGQVAEGADGVEENRPYGDAPTVTNDDVRNVVNMQAVSRPTATVIVGVMDTLLPVLITAVIVKGSEVTSAKLTEGERETLIEAWAVYLGDKNVQASPSVVLLTTIVTIYGAKVIAAVQSRKEQRQAETIARQAAELEELRQEKERLEAKMGKGE